jgi:hypothetical protein
VLQGCFEHAAVWDGRTAPAEARRACWLALAHAALAAGVPGRAYQACAAARELGAKDEASDALLATIVEALTAEAAPTAHDEWQLGVHRRYLDPRGARETIRRARAAVGDDSLLPAERRALESLWNAMR